MRTHLVFLMLGLLVFACGEKLSEDELLTQAAQHEQSEEYEEAVRMYARLVDAYPESAKAPEAQHKTAFIYYNNLKNFEKAIEAHKKLIKRFPESRYVPQARFMVGYIYANNLQDYEKARQAYRTFLEQHPESELVSSVKWELENLGKDINEHVLGSLRETSNGEQTER